MNIEKMTIKEIGEWIDTSGLSLEVREALSGDPRVTVQKLLKKWQRDQDEFARVQSLYSFEDRFYQDGAKFVAGVDEAGRGPLAGPVSVAAVILPPKLHLPKINDSKKISANVREVLYSLVMEQASAVKSIFIAPEVIDELNIYQATVEGMYHVIDALRPKAEAVLVDAVPLEKLMIPWQALIKGDAKSASIAAASIVAKVERDRLMDTFDAQYPQYGFSRHKGYGTAEHLAAIRKYGPCPIHRKTFEPIKSWRL